MAVRLRFAEADNSGVLNAGADDVRISDDTAAPAPTVADIATKERRPAIAGTAGTAAFDADHVHLLAKRGDTTVIDTDVPVSAGAWSVTPVADLADGSYAITVTQADGAGNVGTATATLTVDTTAPDLSVGGVLNDDGIGISGTAGRAAGDRAEVVAKVSGGPTAVADRTLPVGADGSYGTVFAGLAPGSYTVTVTQADAVGNVATRATAFELIPVGPPTLTFGLQGRRDQLLLSKRYVSVHVGCGPVPCRVVISGRAFLRGKRIFRLKRVTVDLPASAVKIVHVPTTVKQRKRIRHALSRKSTRASMRFTAVATGADGRKDTASFSVKLRRLRRG